MDKGEIKRVMGNPILPREIKLKFSVEKFGLYINNA